MTAGIDWSVRETLELGGLVCAATYAADDWIAGLAVAVLWLIWKYLRHEGGVPVLAMALSFQWLQVTAGLWYYAATGRQLDTMVLSDYRPMVLIGLGCILALAAGLRAGVWLVTRGRPRVDWSEGYAIAIGWPALVACYVIGLALQGGLTQLAYEMPTLTQPILVMRFIRLAIVYLILRRLSRPVLRWPWIAAVLAFEVVLGLTGFFAGFRDPLIMAAMALFEAFEPRRVQHWIVTASVAAVMALVSVVWMNVRIDYRASFEDETFAASRQMHIDRMLELVTDWWRQSHDVGEMDSLVDRIWVVYYPALAVSRVPSVLPHTNGSLMVDALQHVFNPRLFFPTKAELQSDSEMVRKYSGVYVAGVETGTTSIAFGYAAESYIDFGLPMMFMPPLVFGVLMGVAFAFLGVRIQHNELRAGLLAVVFWLSLYLFERSWVKTLGLSGTLLVYLGGPALLLDYYLGRSAGQDRQALDGARLWSQPADEAR